MMLYSFDDIRNHVTCILNNNRFQINAIGNHELGRHLVYKITQADEEPLVLKLYCKKNRRGREMASLQLLADTHVKCAKITDAGRLPDGTEWLLYSFFQGEILDRVWEQMSQAQEQHIFQSMGDELGKIHKASTFDFFGHWDEEGKSIYGFRRYFTEFVRSSEYVLRHLQRQELPDKLLLNRAAALIRNNYGLMAPIKEARLTHHDYDGRNILVKQNEECWTIQGVLDFEQSFPGNREIDLAGIYARYLMGQSHREKWFFKGYKEHLDVDELFYQRLPYYLLCKGVVICSWTYRQAPAHYQEGLQLVERFHSLV